MRNSFKTIIAVIFLSIGAAAFSSKIQTDFVTENSANLNFNYSYQKNTPARTLYLNNCARCHGADGKADTELGRLNDTPSLKTGTVKKMSRKRATRIIQNGDGSMPGFKNKLSARDISALVSYIKTL